MRLTHFQWYEYRHPICQLAHLVGLQTNPFSFSEFPGHRLRPLVSSAGNSPEVDHLAAEFVEPRKITCSCLVLESPSHMPKKYSHF